MANNISNKTTKSIFEYFIFYFSKYASQRRFPEYAKTFNSFVENHSLKICKGLDTFFNSCWCRFKRLKWKRLGHTDILNEACTENEQFELVAISQNLEENVKKRRKSFECLGQRMKKERTEELLQHINSFVEKECPELSVTQLLGYLIHRVNIQSQKKIAQVGHDIFTSSFDELDSFNLDEAISLMHSLTLSREQMRKIRNIVGAKGIYFPTSNELLEGQKKLRPVITPVLENRGVMVQYKDVVKMTIESILNLVPAESLEHYSGNLEMIFKDGCDGAGQQAVWNSKSMVNAKENMFQYGITPLKLQIRHEDSNTSILWENKTPNNCRSLRPLYLIREKETDEDLLNFVIPATDNARKELCSEGICATVDMKGYDVRIKIFDTMKDLKFKKTISGLGGADCILCKTKQADWTTTSKVKEGFPINRSASETLSLYNQLISETGKVVTHSGDFETRLGVTRQPITSSDQASITVTHGYINCTTWFLKVIYRCHARHHCWIEKSDQRGDRIRRSRDRVLDALHTETGLYLDKVDSTGKGGTTTNGNQGRRFFSEEVVVCLRNLVPEQYKDNLLLLHQQVATILSVVSSNRKIDTSKFEKLCEEASLNLCKNFPWVLINHTLHGTLQHSAELISINDGYGLGNLSEECLEANNKDIRNYLQFLSRKTDPIQQLTDVMTRLLERSDPKIIQRGLQSQRKKYCTECGGIDHTIKSHARLFGKPKKLYDSIIEEIFLD